MEDDDRVDQGAGEGFSQEECIEWEENVNVDLRSLARSPHMPITPALSTTSSNAKNHNRHGPTSRRSSNSSTLNHEESASDPSIEHIVKNLDKNYSPKQEIAQLLKPPLGQATEASLHEAPTQQQTNTVVGRTATSTDGLGMRHGRRRRESLASRQLQQQSKKLKRSNTDRSDVGGGRRRPRSSGSITSVSSEGNIPHGQAPKMTTNSNDCGVDFEDLLKELDEPRIPLRPARVNRNKGETTKRASINKPNATTTKQHAPPPLPTSQPSSLKTGTPNAKANNYSRRNDASHEQADRKPHDEVPAASTTALKRQKPCPNNTLPPSAVPSMPQSLSVTMRNDVTRPVNAATTVSRPSVGTTTEASAARRQSSTFLLDDDFQVSEDEWAKIMSQAESRQRAPATEKETYSSRDWKTIQAIDESLARAVGHPGVAAVATAPDAKQAAVPNNTNTDEFDDFPMIDFEAMDRQIAERSMRSAKPLPAATQPHASTQVDSVVRNPRSSLFDPQHSYIAFSRYKVVGTKIDNTTYTKTIFLKKWETSMLKKESTLQRPNTKSETDPGTADGHVLLRGEWYHTHVDAGDVVHLCSLSGKYKTDVGALPVILHTSPPHGSDTEDDLVLIVHPDRLIPPTSISETVVCSRRAVLRMRLGSTGISSKAALFGTMRHELFERCMSNQDFTWQTAKVFATNIVRRNAESLVGCGIGESEARTEVLRVVPQIQRFASQYTTFNDKAGNAMSNASGVKLKGNGIQPDMQFVANSVVATEEAVVCPELGVKGNLDVTVSATTDSSNGEPQSSIMSIELKTGHNQNPQNAHMAQLALYTMMLRVRQGPSRPQSSLSHGLSQEMHGACESGMLLYLNHESYRAMHVSPKLNEIKSLVGQRNLVASELTKAARPRGVVLAYEEEEGKDSQLPRRLSTTLLPATPAALPEVLATSQSCSRCYMNRECMTHAAAELRVPSPSQKVHHGADNSHAKLLQHFTGHLDEDHLRYFQEFDRLIDIEADASTCMITKAWLTCSKEQEKGSGKCISSLELDEVETMMANADSAATNDNRSALVVMRRAPDSSTTTPLSRLNIERGSHVVISSDVTSLHLSSRYNALLTQDIENSKVRQFRHRMSIARGFMENIEEKQVTIRVSRDELGQLSRLIKQSQDDPQQPSPESSSSPQSSYPVGLLRFRLDSDDVTTGIGTLRQNLIKFLTSDIKVADEKDAAARAIKQQNSLSQECPRSPRERLPWLRDAIVRMHPPSFDEGLRVSMFDSQGQHRCSGNPALADEFLALASEFSELNDDQRNAVEKIMCAKDYSLVQGLPGTGKSSTIAFVARLLAARGKRVLITSYTHAAVDNLMMKLIESGITSSGHSSPLIRIGNKSSCHPNVHSITASAVALAREAGNGENELPSPDSLSSVLSSAKIVGVSALTIPRSPLLTGQHFDVVIVDEAGQISQPAVLGALMAADSFVLVGDHMQLPPLVHSEAAEQGGYGISMLKRLADKHPSAVAQLTLQYRMHSSICQLSNDIVYDGQLKCASKDIATRQLCLPDFPSAIIKHAKDSPPDSCWMIEAIDPSRPVAFLDTDCIQRMKTPVKCATKSVTNDSNAFTMDLERTTGKNGKGNIVNDTEASLVRQVVHALMACGLEPSRIGVICPFRSQLRLLGQNPTVEEWKSRGLELSTIDRYQGRDKPSIVLSLVRSNGEGNCGRLLEDFRRLNVAVSRAKYKLVIIGSFATLSKGSDVLRPVLQKLQERDQILHLPKDASSRYAAL